MYHYHQLSLSLGLDVSCPAATIRTMVECGIIAQYVEMLLHDNVDLCLTDKVEVLIVISHCKWKGE